LAFTSRVTILNRNPQAANVLKDANKTIDNHVASITRHYEQCADFERIGNYIRHINFPTTIKIYTFIPNVPDSPHALDVHAKSINV